MRLRRLTATAFATPILVLALLAGCGSSSSGAPALGSAGPSAPGSLTGAPGLSTSGPSPSDPGVPTDPTLLGILPATVAGFAVQPLDDPLSEPALVANVDRMARALVVDPATGDFAYVSVVSLRAGVFNDAFFRSWRDSFDTGACQQAGGVAGNAEATIARRQTFIGHCSSGVLTYHVKLLVPDVIVSISSAGNTHLGEAVLGAIRP